MLIYGVPPGVFIIAVFLVLWGCAEVGYKVGLKLGPRCEAGGPLYLPDQVPQAIQATLALILGFTFSMAIARFEARRQLVVDESNQISSTYMAAMALKGGHEEFSSLLKRYLDLRIEFYDHEPTSDEARENEEKTNLVENDIWKTAYRVTRHDRGAIESSFLNQLNQLSDIKMSRNVALKYTLPRMIYWVLILLSMASAFTSSYARIGRRERGQWQPVILVSTISLVLFMILDIDQPREGTIQISQDAMISLREQLGTIASPRVFRGEAAGKAWSSH
jgi:hypothetical protein